MSEEFKCPYCEGTASIAYHRTGNNLLYCHDCEKTFSEVGAKIMKQAARIAELEQENREQLIDYENRLCEARKYQQDSVRRCEELEAERNRLREALVKLKECLEGYFGKTEKDFFEDCNEDSGELYFADVYNAAVNALKKARGEA